MSVVTDKNGTAIGFVFNRDSFISLLEKIDEAFDKKIKNPLSAYNNPAGKLIDLVESTLPVKNTFIKQMKESISSVDKYGWIPLDKVSNFLNA